MADKLDKIFAKQREFMDLLVENDKFPEYPIDLTTKPGQRFFKEVAFNMIEELMESSFTLKNRQHKLSDDTEFDRDHFIEELGDALAYFIEALIVCGISSDQIYDEYSRKNSIVKKRLADGY
jgi:ABC-type transport system involved in multi-copper enzyme maturation permease subunit